MEKKFEFPKENFFEGNFKVSFTYTVEWIGRAAATRRCTAPKMLRSIRVGPHEGGKKLRGMLGAA